MAVNKRLVVLLVIVVVVWAVAIFVLLRTTNQPRSGAAQPTASQGGTAGVAQPTGASTPSTTTVGAIEAPSVEDVLRTPVSVDFLEPYYIDVGRLRESLSVKLRPSTGRSQELPTEGQPTNDSPPSPPMNVEDATTKDLQYAGFMSFHTSDGERKKVFLIVNGEYVSGYEDELIAGRFKVLAAEATFALLLDTSTGKLVKLTYIGD